MPLLYFGADAAHIIGGKIQAGDGAQGNPLVPLYVLTQAAEHALGGSEVPCGQEAEMALIRPTKSVHFGVGADVVDTPMRPGIGAEDEPSIDTYSQAIGHHGVVCRGCPGMMSQFLPLGKEATGWAPSDSGGIIAPSWCESPRACQHTSGA